MNEFWKAWERLSWPQAFVIVGLAVVIAVAEVLS